MNLTFVCILSHIVGKIFFTLFLLSHKSKLLFPILKKMKAYF